MALTIVWAREIGNQAIWDNYTLKFDSMGTVVPIVIADKVSNPQRLFHGSCTLVKNNLSIIILAVILIKI